PVDRAAHAGRGDRAPRLARSGLPADRVLSRNGGVGAAARRPGALRARRGAPRARVRRRLPRSAARRAVAQLPGALPRGEPPAQAHAARLAQALGPPRYPFGARRPRRGRPVVARGAHAALAVAVQLSLLARRLRRTLP